MTVTRALIWGDARSLQERVAAAGAATHITKDDFTGGKSRAELLCLPVFATNLGRLSLLADVTFNANTASVDETVNEVYEVPAVNVLAGNGTDDAEPDNLFYQACSTRSCHRKN